MSGVRRISPILREQRVPLVVDDVVATPANVDLSGHADLIATSLTKFILGTGDAMGGALICHPRSPFHDELKIIVRAQHEELLWGADAEGGAPYVYPDPQQPEKLTGFECDLADALAARPRRVVHGQFHT